jgi:hypothetical protein
VLVLGAALGLSALGELGLLVGALVGVVVAIALLAAARRRR